MNRLLITKYDQIDVDYIDSEIYTGKYLYALSGHKYSVSLIAVSGEWRYSSSDDNTFKQWNIAIEKCIATFDNSLRAGANITDVHGLTEAQISSLQTLGAK
jgi:WD40 repeat protein